jgi:hypothetical protein
MSCALSFYSCNLYIIKHCLDSSFVFSAPLPAWRNLFSASGIFCGGRYWPGCTRIFWPVEGTIQPVTISKKWKNPSSALGKEKDLSTSHSSIQSCSKREDYNVSVLWVSKAWFFLNRKKTNQWSPLQKKKNWALGVATNINSWYALPCISKAVCIKCTAITYPKVSFVIK